MDFRKEVKKIVKKAKSREITNLLQIRVLDYVVSKLDKEGSCRVSVTEMKRFCNVNIGFMSKMQKDKLGYYEKLKGFIQIEKLPKGDYLCTWVYK